MAKNEFTIPLNEIEEGGRYKTHWIDGIPIQCGATGPDNDCAHCNGEKREKIQRWKKKKPFPWKKIAEWRKKNIPDWAISKTNEEICLRCRLESIPCYQCLRKECKEWGIIDQADGVTQVDGCTKRKMFENYCEDFICLQKPKLIEDENRW